MNDADRLREAIRTLRERAQAAIQPDELYPWGDRTLPQSKPEDHPEEVRGYLGGTWGDYYATVPPPVGLALADWLDEEFSHDFGPSEHAITIADLILRDTP